MSILDEPIVLSAICDEPEGHIERYVRQMILTPENLKRFWKESCKFKTLFSTEIKNDFHEFLNVFLTMSPDGVSVIPRGLFWVIDDFVGMFYMTDIVVTIDAKIHYSFFDRRHKGRLELGKAMLQMAFSKYGFRRLSTEIPCYATKHANQFAESLGFQREGRKRKAALFEGTWFDVIQYGILPEELENGKSN